MSLVGMLTLPSSRPHGLQTVPYSCRVLDQKSRIAITKAAVLKAESLQTSVFLTCLLDCAKPGTPVSYVPRMFCSPSMSGLFRH